MAALSCHFHCAIQQLPRNARVRPSFTCSVQPSQSNIKVVVNGAAKEIGRAAVVAVTKARGMEVAGAVDSYFIGEDIGKVCDMEEPLEIPIMNDLTMVLGSISQGCLVAPTLSIGSILLQQAAISASFHYNNVEIVESRAHATDLPSPDAVQIANNLSNLGQIYNREDIATDVLARGQLIGEDGVRVHSMVLPGLPSSTTVYFSGPGEVYTIKHAITDVQCLMPGLLLAIRKVVRLKHLVYGLEKFL
ncbi:dihydrodipicolinate reductase-like protein CRR1, chloroplastic isoform X3 [Herrania umbratica]|uniref:Dihydrodipicolinate reductase-like protein CRR1, chloroplastic isoform X3 n=1 Tax=Herrania umbratica TaxID=108875 RepID=A0A6J1ACQ0_9ROSI|nr:dihydrodipicolinate reductase-like protein CRR1, chloroplastic isoform X3 [Herrania umbratica]